MMEKPTNDWKSGLWGSPKFTEVNRRRIKHIKSVKMTKKAKLKEKKL